jgi:hypothetical protein
MQNQYCLKENAIGLLMGEREGNRSPGSLRRFWVGIIKFDTRVIVLGGMDWTYLA